MAPASGSGLAVRAGRARGMRVAMTAAQTSGSSDTPSAPQKSSPDRASTIPVIVDSSKSWSTPA